MIKKFRGEISKLIKALFAKDRPRVRIVSWLVGWLVGVSGGEKLFIFMFQSLLRRERKLGSVEHVRNKRRKWVCEDQGRSCYSECGRDSIPTPDCSSTFIPFWTGMQWICLKTNASPNDWWTQYGEPFPLKLKSLQLFDFNSVPFVISDSSCNATLGLESGTVEDTHMTASSSFDHHSTGPQNAR